MADRDFDSIEEEYVVAGEEFKSWNADPNFRFNALYFKFRKPYKVKVEFWGDEKYLDGVVDILSWPNSYYEFRPTRITIHYGIRHEPRKPAHFEFYTDPFFFGASEGSFEPRVYELGNVAKVVIKKLLELEENKRSKYSLFLIRRAKEMYELAREKERGKDYGLSLHFSRFCIELSLKSIFPTFEHTIPHEHDVSGHFSKKLRNRIGNKLPTFMDDLPRLLWISQLHSRLDRLDFYGDPLSQTPPHLFMTPDEAQVALKHAELCHRKCCELFDCVMRKAS